VENLVVWFTTDWLNADHEDQMLELLAADLGLSEEDRQEHAKEIRAVPQGLRRRQISLHLLRHWQSLV
jgi:hypothetical protein